MKVWSRIHSSFFKTSKCLKGTKLYAMSNNMKRDAMIRIRKNVFASILSLLRMPFTCFLCSASNFLMSVVIEEYFSSSGLYCLILCTFELCCYRFWLFCYIRLSSCCSISCFISSRASSTTAWSNKSKLVKSFAPSELLDRCPTSESISEALSLRFDSFVINFLKN